MEINKGIIFLLFVLLSCSTTNKIENKKSIQEDLIEVFSLDSEKFAKFKEVKKDSSETVEEKTKKVKPSKKSNVSKEKIEKKQQHVVEKDPQKYPDVYLEYDEDSKEVWRKYNPKIFINEKMTIDVKFFGIKAGTITVETKPVRILGGRQVYHYYAKIVSAPFYKYIYTLDDYVESYVDKEKNVPMKFVLIQRESKKQIDDLQLFDSEQKKTYSWYRRIKKGKEKKEKKESFIPSKFQDSFSTLFFLRGLPLKLGVEYRFPVVTRGKVWMVKAKAVKIETITIMDKEYKAYRIKAVTKFPGVLKKRGDITFWFSADETRKILKFEAKIKIGSVYGELVEFEDGEEI